MKQFITLVLLLLFSCAQKKPEIDVPIVEDKPEVQSLQQSNADLNTFIKRIDLQWNAIQVSGSRNSPEITMETWLEKNKPDTVDSFDIRFEDETYIDLYFAKDEKREIKLPARVHSARDMMLETNPNRLKGKPIIYLYPEEETEVSVTLQFDGKLTYTYPTYPEDGWRITAHPDGRLVDTDGKEYYSLFWEGYSSESGELPSGFVVHRDSVNSFLDEKLTILGLNYRERQEFIVFWAPVLMKSEYSTVHFATDEYVKRVPLVVSPKPETQIRVMMYFKAARLGEELKRQELVPVIRKGFTLVEWGGCNLDKPVRHYN